jgi:hypothetical protein
VSLVPQDDPAPRDGGSPGFLGGLDAGWRALVAATSVVLTALGAVVPFAGVVAAGTGLVWLAFVLRRARARRRPAAGTPGRGTYPRDP